MTPLVALVHRRLTAAPSHLHGEALHAFAAIGSAILMGLVCHALFLVLFLLLGSYALAGFNVGSVLVFAALFFGAIPRGRLRLAVSVASLEVTLHAWFATATLGWVSASRTARPLKGPR